MRTKTNKNRKRIAGDIIRVDLGDGFHTYARVLEEALFAFYDARVADELAIDRIIALPILFKITVMDKAVTNGRWAVVGNTPLDDALLDLPPFFMQDILRKDPFSIYEKGGTIRPATKEECLGLERAAAWDATHVEDRLRDYYAKRKNKWLESLKIKE
jgi:Immunity protein 26